MSSPETPLEGWQTVTNDYSKTIITLSVAFLAFTVTFWKDILPAESHDSWYPWLVGVWILLLIAIGSALVSAGLLVRVLLKKGRRPPLMLAANLSYFCFLLAAIAFLILGWGVVSLEMSFNDVNALKITRAVIDQSKQYPEEHWNLESFYVQNGMYTALYSNKVDRKISTVKVKWIDRCIITSSRILESVKGRSIQNGLGKWTVTKNCQ